MPVVDTLPCTPEKNTSDVTDPTPAPLSVPAILKHCFIAYVLCVGAHVCHDTRVKVRGQPMGVCSLISSREFQDPNSGNNIACRQVLCTQSRLTDPYLPFSGAVLAV